MQAHLVVWQQQVVEAGVGSGQPVTVRPSPADSEGGCEAGQPLDRHPITACHKEQQLLLLLLLQAMHHLPEPFHHLQFAVPSYVKQGACEPNYLRVLPVKFFS